MNELDSNAQGKHGELDKGQTKQGILLASVGMSPAVVTETLWALMNPHEQSDATWRNERPFAPRRIHVMTTALGKRRIEQRGLQQHIRELYVRYGWPEPRVIIEAPRDAGGREIEDINTEAENSAFADRITELVRQYTSDEKARLHVSLAGGRKTMTSFTHAAMTYFGRPQDRLSHVLVEPPVLERCQDFWWPGQPEETVLTMDGSPVSTRMSEARAVLVETPFVRLRHLIDMEGLPVPVSHAELVRRLQEALQAQHVVLHFSSRTLRIGGYVVKLSPREFAVYATLAGALKGYVRSQGTSETGLLKRGWLTASDFVERDSAVAAHFATLYEEVGGVEKMEKWKNNLHQGKAELRDQFDQDRSRINGKIGNGIDILPVRNRVIIHRDKRKAGREAHFGLLLEPHQIEFDRNL